MWSVLSNRVRFSLIAIATFIFLFFYFAVFGVQVSDPSFDLGVLSGYGKIISVLTYYWVGLFFILKFSGMIFWRLPIVGGWLDKNVCPYLDGVWVSTLSYSLPDGEVQEKQLRFNVKMDFFHFEMVMQSDDRYSFSNVVASRILKDEVLNSFVVYYVFESEVKDPLPTDVSVFQGASKLRVTSAGVLEGTYWTNRNYQNSKHTAGAIRIVRLD